MHSIDLFNSGLSFHIKRISNHLKSKLSLDNFEEEPNEDRALF